MEDFYSTWRETVEKVAKTVARDFPDVEEEDLTQDLYVALLERSFKSPDDNGAVLFLRKVAKERAMAYRAQHLILSPQYNYRTSEVRSALEQVFSYDDWVPKRGAIACDDEGEVLPVAHSGSYDPEDLWATHTDIKRALTRLPDHYRKIIEKRYRDGWTPETDADRKTLSRAIERLTDALNSYYPSGAHEGPGSRKIPSNASAQHIIRQSYGP